MKVLTNYKELGECIDNLRKKNISFHGGDPRKNWDIWNIYQLLKNKDRDIRIFDFGCGNCSNLKCLYEMGFNDLHGYDLYDTFESYYLYLQQKFYILARKIKNNENIYNIHKGNALNTSYPRRHFNVIICLSVIEHAVPIGEFFNESYRVLKPGGLLYVSTDFWQNKKDIEETPNHKVFNKKEIDELIKTAKSYGFEPREKDLNPIKDRFVFRPDMKYTFISIVFEKVIE